MYRYLYPDYSGKNLSLYKDKTFKLSQKVVAGLVHYLYLFGLIQPSRQFNTYIKFLLL